MNLNRSWLVCSLLLVFVVAGPVVAEDDLETTTWFVVRHADRDGDRDALTDAGRQRAEQLSQILGALRVEAVYSTQFDRTRDTARPVVRALGLADIRSYGRLSADWFAAVRDKHQGQAVLIVGHSNTVPAIVRGLGAAADFEIAENEFDNLFVVSQQGNRTTVVRLRYGKKQ